MTPVVFSIPAVGRFVLVSLSVSALCGTVALQAAKPGKEERLEKMERREAGSSAVKGPSKVDEAQGRSLLKLRELMEVTDDSEWAVIVERITQVGELRRGLASPAIGKGASSLMDKSKRGGISGQPEQDALRAALVAKLPDAEIKSRLSRMHDAHQQNQARLTKAQEALRSVLTIRQEAVAVMAGLLPP